MGTLSIGFIGAGNMASALIGGLSESGFDANDLYVADLNKKKSSALTDHFAVQTCDHNQSLLDCCDVVVLAVKPQVMKSVLEDLNAKPDQLFLSIAAGVRSNSLQNWLGEECAIVRSMPNTPALVQCGATGLFANQYVNAAQRQQADQIMSAIGITIWVDQESQLDAVTAVSGSGPAYFFYMMEAIETAGIELGLSPENSRALTLQTALGAAKLAMSGDESTAELRARVTSAGGTTAAAIDYLQAKQGLDNIKQAVGAAYNRSQQLAEQLADG
ncbi:Pyrroline-5-carboxylate reductase [hydrothermal vent metagenome]|uniref:Pyrroline-5-carboxylate reductase n=1 Tax=hydrothermal vent metagenome TaxID=652676 RepID=A0A3B1AKX5_9ZZZZ